MAQCCPQNGMVSNQKSHGFDGRFKALIMDSRRSQKEDAMPGTFCNQQLALWIKCSQAAVLGVEGMT